nr:S79 protein [Flammulina filiformis]
MKMDSIPLAPLFGMYYQEMPEAHAYTHIAQLLNRLESYSEGLDDLYQLLCAYSASSPDVSPVSLLELVQIARDTLLRSGVKLHAAVPCRHDMTPHRRSYFSLLYALKNKRPLFPAALQDQLSRFVLPLASAALLRRSVRTSNRQRCATSTTPRRIEDDRYLMPPPDMFPPRSSLVCRQRKPMVFPREVIQRYIASEAEDSDVEEEEKDDTSRRFVMQPLTKRFGIWCGSSTSMFRMRD